MAYKLRNSHLGQTTAGQAVTPASSSPAIVSLMRPEFRMIGRFSLPGQQTPLAVPVPQSVLPAVASSGPVLAPGAGYYTTTDAAGDTISAPAVSNTGALMPSTPPPAGYQYTTDANGDWVLTPIPSTAAATTTSEITIGGTTISTTTLLLIGGGVLLVLFFMSRGKK
jgi:hypothetical protein